MTSVSVIIPTYNQAAYIGLTVQSVLDQTHAPLEIIVVDDGSTDDTAQVISTFGTKVKYLRKENGGVASARNAGICIATGHFVACLDSDDLWVPTKLQTQIDLLTRSGMAWAYSDATIFDSETGQSIGPYSQQSPTPQEGYVAHKLIMGNFIPSPSPLIRRGVFGQVGMYNECRDLQWAADWEMWLRIAAHFPVAFSPEELVRYRIHNSNMTKGEDALSSHRKRMLAISQAIETAPAAYVTVKDRAIAVELTRTGRVLASQGKMDQARGFFTKAIRQYPLSINPYLFLGASTVGYSTLKHIKNGLSKIRSLVIR